MAQYNKSVLIIFDLVATLTDAGPRYVQAFLESCEKHGLPKPTEAQILAMLGNKTLSEITDQSVGKLDDDKKRAFMQSCNQTCDALLGRTSWKEELYPRAKEALQTLTAQGASFGIYTATRADALEAQLNYHGITAAFDPRYIRGKDNARDQGKTNAELKFEQLQSIVTDYRKEQGYNAPVIVIGDSEADASAAAKLGLFFIGFAANAAKQDALNKSDVEIVIKDFGTLPDLVARLMLPDLINHLMNPPANDNVKLPPMILPATPGKNSAPHTP